MTGNQTTDDHPSGADIVGSTIAESDTSVSRTHTIADLEHLVSEIGWNRLRADLLAEDSTQLQVEYHRLHEEGRRQLLRVRTAEHAKRDVQSLLIELGDGGFSWSDIARAVGVSVPALRKWRQGDSPTGENRRRIAEVVAIYKLISERSPIISDVVGWLETPLLQGSPTSGIDLLIERREDLLLEYADGADPEEILDAFDPSWRERAQISDDVEVFTAWDGMPALRLRRGGG